MKKIKKQVVLILPAVIILNMFSCSTKKKTFIHRKYHNITAKYNGYFNGKESLKQGIKKIEKSYVLILCLIFYMLFSVSCLRNPSVKK